MMQATQPWQARPCGRPGDPGRRAWLQHLGALAAGAIALPGCSDDPLVRTAGEALGIPAEVLTWGLPEAEGHVLAGQVLQALAQRSPAGTAPAALVQGMALDRAAGLLRAPDLQGALVTLGQQVLAVGERGFRPWHVGVADPATGRAYVHFDLYAGERLVTVTPPAGGACASCSAIVRGAADGGAQAARLALALAEVPAAQRAVQARTLGAELAIWLPAPGVPDRAPLATALMAARAAAVDDRHPLRRI